MPDLLAHALIAYGVCTVLSWRYGWIGPAYVTAGMAGAFVPDLAKGEILVHSFTVADVLGVPFDWFALHTAGGVLVSILIGVALVADGERRRVALLLGLGALTHLVADALLRSASGRSYPLLWPLTEYAPPTPGLYLSTEPGPTIAAAAFALVAWGVDRWGVPRWRHADG